MREKSEHKKKKFEVRELRIEDKSWLIQLMEEQWASTRIVTKGKVHLTENLPGFIVIHKKRRAGVITYNIVNEECEIVSLNSLIENIGIGTNLLVSLENIAKSKGCTRIWLITTNDNVDALRFFQLKGYHIKEININAIANSRKLKPEIPLLGFYNIEIRDEIKLEKLLNS